jgi:hypothetical protein
MGIRRSSGKDKEDDRPTDATTVEREDMLRRVANVRTRFDSTRRGPGPAADRAARAAAPSPDGRATPRGSGASPGK